MRSLQILGECAVASHVPPVPAPRRFGPWFVEPVIAGLNADGTPFITAMDLVGAEVFTTDFVVAGTCSESLYGMCESLYRCVRGWG